MSAIQLVGTGAAYIRVSSDTQDTERQLQLVHDFLSRNGAKIAERYWFEDQGWARDFDKERPAFQRLLKLAERGEIKWIVIEILDRFGTKNAKRLFAYLSALEDAGCKLYDVSGKEWTGEDDGTEIEAWIGGKASTREQKVKSARSLSGMVQRARAGEWMGAPPKLGFDVGCFDRATGAELWRVVWEGREAIKKRGKNEAEEHTNRVLRRKIYPGGGEERFDGEVVFRTSRDAQVMRIVPTRDAVKLRAAKGVFGRYATEAITFTGLAKWLNGLKVRNSFGNGFQANDVSRMLSDESYLGYPTFNKRRAGRFHRSDEDGKLTELEPELRGKETSTKPEAVIRCGTRLFEPLVDRPTWDAVQRKLTGRNKTKRVPRGYKMFLSGLVVCAECGRAMVARAERDEYVCSMWNNHRMRGTISESPCQSNPVKQAVLDEYVRRYLDETGQRLELLTDGSASENLTGALEKDEAGHWVKFVEGVRRLTEYLAKNRPDEYAAILREDAARHKVQREINAREYATGENPLPGARPGTLVKRYGKKIIEAAESALKRDSAQLSPDDFVTDVLRCYRGAFDSAAVERELGAIRKEHGEWVVKWGDLPTKRAKEVAAARLKELEERLENLEQQKEDVSETVLGHYRAVQDLSLAVARAVEAMNGETGEHALRHRSEALRAVLCRIECRFVLTTRPTQGRGNWVRSKLEAVTFVPIAGDVYEVSGATDTTASHGTPWGRCRPRG